MRQALAWRRVCTTFEFRCGHVAYVATYSRFADGRLAEIFLTTTKHGSDADNISRDSAICASLALQSGCALADVRKGLSRDGLGRPISPLAFALDVIDRFP